MARDAEIFNLFKYFIWADRMRNAYDALLDQNIHELLPRIKFEMESNLYMSYWFGALYVVIEGWKQLHLSDKKIASLLDSPNVNLLRRYRNGVFHFQRDYFDERFLSFLRDGVNRIEWARDLHHEFERYFSEWAEVRGGFL